MADGTKIEWADATLNYVNGCSLASPGCTNCYAMKQAHRFPVRRGLTVHTKGGMVWTGEVRENPKALEQALAWKRGRAIFWNAHGDLFHESVPDEWIDRQFAVMALTPQHRHMVLTKRSARMRKYVTHLEQEDQRATIRRITAVWPQGVPVPEGGIAVNGPNVWLGVSVEDQQRADERIPDLLATPAAVRFISAEPLLGDLNIRSALRPRQPYAAADLPDRWADFKWPEWVPEVVAARVMEFWREAYGRSPRAWLRDAITQGGPALWSEATLRLLTQAGDPVTGRFVHMWNNIGCVVGPGGEFAQGSFVGSGVYSAVVENGRGLDWVIVGGESGPGARPMHPDWARSLRDQCQAAGVAFHFKQWGEWYPAWDRPSEAVPPGEARAVHTWPDSQRVARVGKEAAGRLLDGVEHNGVPDHG